LAAQRLAYLLVVFNNYLLLGLCCIALEACQGADLPY
jgi:hypothetical protein